MHSYPSPQILPHMGKDLSFLSPKIKIRLSLMGKESSFLPQKCKANLPHTGKESCFLPSMLKVHPSPGSASPQNATLNFLTEGRILPPSKCKISTNPSLQIIFLYLYIFFFSLLFRFWVFFFFFFFQKTWNSSPKWKSYSPAFGANNRRIDAPDSVWTTDIGRSQNLHHLYPGMGLGGFGFFPQFK